MTKTKFIMLVGLSGAGKSTYAKKICKESGAVHLASDAVRDAIYGSRKHQDNPSLVFEICHKATIENLRRGRSVVLDATNLRSKNRIQILQQIRKELPETVCEAHVLVVEFDECIKQNVRREFAIPRPVLERQIHQFQIPFMEEGWDKITLVPPEGCHFKYNNLLTYSLQRFAKEAEGFDQHTPYHDLTLLEHSNKHWDYIGKKVEESFDGEEEVSIRGGGFMYWASPLHDYGKLFTHTEAEDGTWHYYGHAELGAYKLLCDALEPDFGSVTHKNVMEKKDILYDIEMNNIIETIFYVNYHMLPFDWKSDKTKEKARRIFGNEKYNNLMLMHEADILGKNIPGIGENNPESGLER